MNINELISLSEIMKQVREQKVTSTVLAIYVMGHIEGIVLGHNPNKENIHSIKWKQQQKVVMTLSYNSINHERNHDFRISKIYLSINLSNLLCIDDSSLSPTQTTLDAPQVMQFHFHLFLPTDVLHTDPVKKL